MKFRKNNIIIFIVLSLFSWLFVSCDNVNQNQTDDSTVNKEVVKDVNSISLFTGYNIYENDDSSKYEIVDSFKLPDGKSYYLFLLGAIDAAPIGIDNSDGLYYNGVDTELKFDLKTSSTISVTKSVKSISSKTVSVKNGISQGISFGSDATISKFNVGINYEATNTITESFESSVTRAVSETNEFTKSVTFRFNSSTNEAGYYCYTSLASLKIYQAIVYNPETSKIEEMTPYTVVGKAMPGLLYSKTSFFMYDTPKIEFDLAKINSFPSPQTVLDKEIDVIFNANGGSCDTLNRNYRICEQYGELPTPFWKGHNFLGWYINDYKVNENDIILSNEPLVAKWETVTKGFYTIARYQAQNGFGSSEEMDTSVITLNLSSIFDVGYLKDNNYKLKMTIEFDVNYLTSGLGKLNYYLKVNCGKNTIYKIEDTISGFTHRLYTSSQLDSSLYDGVLSLNLYTANIQGVLLTNFKITFEFFE